MTKHVFIAVWNISSLASIEEFVFCWWILSDYTITNREYHMVVEWLHFDRPWEIWKNILYIWFSHFTWIETHWCWNYSLPLYFNEKRFSMRSMLTHLLAMEPSVNCWIAVERSKMTFISIFFIANQNVKAIWAVEQTDFVGSQMQQDIAVLEISR